MQSLIHHQAVLSIRGWPCFILRLLLGGTLLFSLSACRSNTSPPPSPTPPVAVASPTTPPTGTPAPTQTASPYPTATATATRVSLPEEHYIDIAGHHQYFKIGCEASAAVDWAEFYGVQINEYEFQYKLPISDNPDYGFVGSADGPWGQSPPYAYGVHAAPVAALLNQYGVAAKAVKNYPLEAIKQQLAAGNPVIAWVIGNMVGGIPAEYVDSQGRKTIVAAYEHVVILTGYNEKAQRIRYLNNGRFYEIPYDYFLNSWKVLDQMALIRN
jgi:uncharacterized protein YvpB